MDINKKKAEFILQNYPVDMLNIKIGSTVWVWTMGKLFRVYVLSLARSEFNKARLALNKGEVPVPFSVKGVVMDKASGFKQPELQHTSSVYAARQLYFKANHVLSAEGLRLVCQQEDKPDEILTELFPDIDTKPNLAYRKAWSTVREYVKLHPQFKVCDSYDRPAIQARLNPTHTIDVVFSYTDNQHSYTAVLYEDKQVVLQSKPLPSIEAALVELSTGYKQSLLSVA